MVHTFHCRLRVPVVVLPYARESHMVCLQRILACASDCFSRASSGLTASVYPGLAFDIQMQRILKLQRSRRVPFTGSLFMLRLHFNPMARKRNVVLFARLDDKVNIVSESDVACNGLHNGI
jgi:hypothetical protein